MPELSKAAKVSIRAQMVRGQIAPHQLQSYWCPDRNGTVNPLKDPEVLEEIVDFLSWLWRATDINE